MTNPGKLDGTPLDHFRLAIIAASWPGDLRVDLIPGLDRTSAVIASVWLLLDR